MESKSRVPDTADTTLAILNSITNHRRYFEEPHKNHPKKLKNDVKQMDEWYTKTFQHIVLKRILGKFENPSDAFDQQTIQKQYNDLLVQCRYFQNDESSRRYVLQAPSLTVASFQGHRLSIVGVRVSGYRAIV